MSYTTEVTIWCDGQDPDGQRCGVWTYGKGGPFRTASDARAGAARYGWARRDGRDLCPDHAKQEATDV